MTNECQRSKDKNKTGRSASHFGFDHSSFFRIYTGCQKKFLKWWGKPAGLPRRPAGRRPPFQKFLLAISLVIRISEFVEASCAERGSRLARTLAPPDSGHFL